MKILFEEHTYPTHLLYIFLDSYYFEITRNPNNAKIKYVGYFFNPKLNDTVFILPKVFLYNGGLAFGKWNPEEIIDFELINDPELKDKRHTIFELSVWLYQAISQFYKKYLTTSIVDNNNYINNIISNLEHSSKTELDIVLSLLRFYKENKHFFTRINKLKHSQYHKTDWIKTVTKEQPFINNNRPVYINFISKKKTINYDEDLLIIFYSVLNYLKSKYGFHFILNENYNLIEKKQFKKLLMKGTRTLKSIRYKYFSDILISLWKLLYIFFERSEQIQEGRKKEEVFLIRNFNILFEDMIDDLIGDKDLPSYLKNHKDGKQLDHIYQYESLISTDNIYFLGDSKYYKPDRDILGESIHKQYTYAKNVIQYNIDIFNRNELNQNIRYRDELTEGYNITPNFFISAFINDEFNFLSDEFNEENNPHLSYHYKNRLFDRDTLYIQQYNINFLFVLSAYVSRNSKIKTSFKTKSRDKFRTRMINFFNEEYNFYTVNPNENIQKFITKYFRSLCGKIYRPSCMNNELIIGILKEDNETLDIIKNDCITQAFQLH